VAPIDDDGGESESGWQWLEWIRKGVELFGTSGFQHAYDELWQEDQPIIQMETAPAPLQPDLQFLAQQLNEGSADPPGSSSAQQTTPGIKADITRRCIGSQRPSQIFFVSMRCGVFGQ
jgi:hypothetical protein